jgi:tight adherence protein B
VSQAQASTQPGPVTLGAVSAAQGEIRGLLSVAGSEVTLDNTTLTGVVGGRSYRVSVAPIARVSRATMLVVDTSGSMGESGMATVRSSVSAFLKVVPADVSVGLTSFADTAGVDVQPTKDRSAVLAAVNALESQGETTLYDGLLAGSAALSRFESRSLILLSDGGDTRSRKGTQANVTAALRRARVHTEVIAFRSGEVNTTALRSFAAAGGGRVAAADSAAEVESVFHGAAQALRSQVAFTLRPGVEVVDAQKLVITGTAGGRVFEAQSPIDLRRANLVATGPSAAVPSQALPEPSVAPRAVSDVFLLVGAAAFGLGILGIVIALAAPLLRSRRSERVASIEAYVSGTGPATGRAGVTASPSAISAGLVNFGDRVMSTRESTSKTMALIERADLPLRAGEWWVLRLVSLVVCVAGALVVFHGGLILTVLAVVVGATAGALLPAVVLRVKASHRRRKFEAQLPDTLMLVASSLSTGFSLPQALDAVTRDSADPISKEFSRALAETRIGADISDALEHMAGRLDSDNMRWTAMAIRIQREVGGNLAEVLRTTAHTMRDREALQRQVSALSAEGKLSAYILIAMPIGIGLYMLKINYDYIALLWSNMIGIAMLGFGLLSMAVGIVWLRKIVVVEV